MSNQKKANESLYNIPLFRKVKEPSTNEKNINNINKHKDSHCLEDFQKELNNLHLDAQNQYEKICKNKSLHKTQENLLEDFMDPEWFAREAENRKKHSLQKQSEDVSMMISPIPTQTKEDLQMDNFPRQQTIEKFFPMGTMTASTNKKTTKQSYNTLNDLPKLDKQNKNTSSLSFAFNDNKKQQELVFDNPKKSTRKRNSSPTLYEEYKWNQKQKNKSKYLKNNFINTTNSKKCILQNKEEYRSFLKWNFTIFITAFINVLLILLICFSYLQTQISQNLQIPSNMVSNIYRHFFIMSLLFAYQIASLHCGYTIAKHRLIEMKKTTKVLLYPILLVILLIIGFICEIPYYIFSCFQLENNIP